MVRDAVVLAEVAEVVFCPEMLHEFVVVEVALVAELAERMTSMRPVVRVALPPMLS